MSCQRTRFTLRRRGRTSMTGADGGMPSSGSSRVRSYRFSGCCPARGFAVLGRSAAAMLVFGRHRRVRGWHAMPGFEQCCFPSVVVQARHSRRVSMHPCGAASRSANMRTIIVSLRLGKCQQIAGACSAASSDGSEPQESGLRSTSSVATQRYHGQDAEGI